ncbi:Hypothetical predicted protein [Mytilus galloprovincialis]|uniref:Uncharacterized protein n=1 Tax=Mytilus galloprovincialis TaxID=29158 RepID=A0A8B6C6W4_MYTGA|nr:Hypothetical predicted protein [Mytilus galloprovincialis]
MECSRYRYFVLLYICFHTCIRSNEGFRLFESPPNNGLPEDIVTNADVIDYKVNLSGKDLYMYIVQALKSGRPFGESRRKQMQALRFGK